MSNHGLLDPWKGLLIHDLELFDPSRQRARARSVQAAQVESFGWNYELVAQVERRSKLSTLYGGACAALHLPIGEQRASVDADLFWSGTEDEMRALLSAIESELAREGYFHFDERKVVLPHTNLRLLRFFVKCPSPAGQQGIDGTPGATVKFDIALHEAPASEARPPQEVLPFVTVEHRALPLKHLLAAKLLALASGEGGVPIQKGAALAKHVYDLVHLQSSISTNEELLEVGANLKTLVDQENLWLKKAVSSQGCIDAIGTAIDHMRTHDRRDEIDGFSRTYLQEPFNKMDWVWAQEQVRHFALAATGRSSPREYLDARAYVEFITPLVEALEPSALRALVEGLAKAIEARVGSAGKENRTQAPQVLVWRLSSMRAFSDAQAVCDRFLSPWPSAREAGRAQRDGT